MKLLSLIIALLFPSCHLMSGGFTIDIPRAPSRWPIKAQLRLTFIVRNVSGKSYRFPVGDGLQVFGKVHINGVEQVDCNVSYPLQYTGADKTMPTNWTYIAQFFIRCTDSPGTLSIRFFIAPTVGKGHMENTGFVPPKLLRKFSISSKIKTIVLTQPETAADIAAFQYISKNRPGSGYSQFAMVSEFPKSNFTGALLSQNIAGVSKYYFSDTLKPAVSQPNRKLDCRDGATPEVADQTCRNWLEPIRAAYAQFIQNNPHFHELPEIRAQYAFILIALNRIREAIEQIKLVAATPGVYMERARVSLKDYDELLKEQYLPPQFIASFLAYPRQIPIGIAIPARLSVRNVSGHEIPLQKFPRIYGNVFAIRADSKRDPRCDSSFDIYSNLKYQSNETYHRNWHGEWLALLWCATETPGDVDLVFDFNFEIYFTKTQRERYEYDPEARARQLKTESTEVHVIMPEGDDKLAYDYYRGDFKALQNPLNLNEMARKFPASYYFAQNFYRSQYLYLSNNFNGWYGLRVLQSSAYLDCGAGHLDSDGLWKRFQGRNSALWRISIIDLILTHQPDIWMKDELRLLKAIDQIALRDFTAADQSLTRLVIHGPEYIAENAADYRKIIHDPKWLNDVDKIPSHCID